MIGRFLRKKFVNLPVSASLDKLAGRPQIVIGDGTIDGDIAMVPVVIAGRTEKSREGARWTVMGEASRGITPPGGKVEWVYQGIGKKKNWREGDLWLSSFIIYYKQRALPEPEDEKEKKGGK